MGEEGEYLSHWPLRIVPNRLAAELAPEPVGQVLVPADERARQFVKASVLLRLDLESKTKILGQHPIHHGNSLHLQLTLCV